MARLSALLIEIITILVIVKTKPFGLRVSFRINSNLMLGDNDDIEITLVAGTAPQTGPHHEDASVMFGVLH